MKGKISNLQAISAWVWRTAKYLKLWRNLGFMDFGKRMSFSGGYVYSVASSGRYAIQQMQEQVTDDDVRNEEGEL